MNIFCRVFGHTWWPEVEVPHLRWNTTKDGHILAPTSDGEDVRHWERCKRCDEVKEVAARPHDQDRSFETTKPIDI